MLMNRIIGAFTFKREVYAEVKKDPSFTTTAWGIVIGVQLINQIASYLAAPIIAAATINALGGFGDLGAVGAVSTLSPVGAVIGAVIGVAAFAISVFVVQFVAKSMFQSTATFDELVRTMGLASVWGIVGALVILAVISPALLCITGLVGFAAAILGAISSAIAIKEALALDWTQTIITIVIAVVVGIVVSAVLGSVLGGLMYIGA